MSDPTTGGVFASYAVLGDVNIAEPNALIGFAGARVAAGTIAQELPPGFQRAEFLFEHGFVDRVVHRSALRSELGQLLRYLTPAEPALAGPDDAGRPAFDPVRILTSLADRYVPEAGEAATIAEPAAPAGSVPNGKGRGRG
jgi:acetyl-CoA carboxylase carboxyl transferase subunit beta